MRINLKLKMFGLFLLFAFLCKNPFIVQQSLANPDSCTCTGKMVCNANKSSASCSCSCVPAGCTTIGGLCHGCATAPPTPDGCAGVCGNSCSCTITYECAPGPTSPPRPTPTPAASCDELCKQDGYSSGTCRGLSVDCRFQNTCSSNEVNIGRDNCTAWAGRSCCCCRIAPTPTPTSNPRCVIDGPEQVEAGSDNQYSVTDYELGGGRKTYQWSAVCTTDSSQACGSFSFRENARTVIWRAPRTYQCPRPTPTPFWQRGDGTGQQGNFCQINATVSAQRSAICSKQVEILPAPTPTPTPTNQNPVCRLNAVPSSGTAPLNVTLDGSTSYDPDGSIVKYEWDFTNNGSYEYSESPGDGIAQCSNSSDCPYSSSATAILRVTDNDGASRTCSDSITVNQSPTCLCAVAPTTTTLGNSIQFRGDGSSDADGSIVSYRWNLGDGIGTSTQMNPVYTYGSIGAFTANLTVTDNNSATSPCNCSQVTVNQPTGTISGFAFDDDNGNGCFNAGPDSRLDGVEIRAAGITTYTRTTGPNGEFSFAGIPADTYTLTVLSYPAGYLGVSGWDDDESCNCPDPPDCQLRRTVVLSAGGTAQRLVGLKSDPDPWFQTENGNVHSNNSLTQTIPPDKYFMNGVTSSEGVLTAQNSISIGGGKISRRDPNNWKDGAYGTITTPTYETLWNNYKSKLVSDKTSWPNPVPTGVVRVKSDVNLNTTRWQAISGNPTVIFIGDEAGDGSVIPRNLTITDNLTGKKVIFVVSGNVTLNKQVEDIQGIIICDGIFDTASVAVVQGEDRPLNFTGTVIANQFSLERRRSDNNNPSEKFVYNPSFLIDFISLLGKPNYTWQEVAP